MDHFTRQSGELWAEGVRLTDIAQAVGTPTYVYSRATLERHYQVMDQSLAGVDHLICFAVKSCSNLAVLQVLARLGSGFDIVSAGELARVLQAGGDPAKVVFSGVGKRDDEIAAALQAQILCLNVESADELKHIANVAEQLGVRAPVSMRVNPDVDPKTHKYIATGLKTSKFGVSFGEAEQLYLDAARHPHLQVVGIACHIGSQILQVAPFVEAVAKVLTLAASLRAAGVQLDHIDVGGGLGIAYRDETPALPEELGQVIQAMTKSSGLRVLMEPGRVIVGNAGVLLTRVIGTKRNEQKQFAIVDAGMNDLLRPALYDAYHQIELVADAQARQRAVVDVVGPVCETGDFLALDRELPVLSRGDLLAVKGTGAYGFAMASNYNSRPRPAEVLVSDGQFQVVRQREGLAELWRGEALWRD